MLATLVRSRKICLGLIGLGLLHFSLLTLGLPSWQCPIRAGLGVPCPGCGLSRATIEFMHGHIDHALEIHAFAPLVVLVIGLMGSAIVLPQSRHSKLVHLLERLESRNRLTILLIGSLLGYWLVRFLFFREMLYQLVM
ncbi:MAG: DUF2752 domain-containing protein [Leptolyngbya sp. Prado105]|jgi:hypothetical protein|nr:DUF2752 domain-containing protein [Leptolyngbya sp. Prado105]